jgi:hypothetical protein
MHYNTNAKATKKSGSQKNSKHLPRCKRYNNLPQNPTTKNKTNATIKASFHTTRARDNLHVLAK